MKGKKKISITTALQSAVKKGSVIAARISFNVFCAELQGNRNSRPGYSTKQSGAARSLRHRGQRN
jgi:hypothetical protein